MHKRQEDGVAGNVVSAWANSKPKLQCPNLQIFPRADTLNVREQSALESEGQNAARVQNYIIGVAQVSLKIQWTLF